MVEAKAAGRVRPRSRDAVVHVLTHSSEPASRLIWIYAIAMGAFQGVNAILALFLAARFGVTAKTVWVFFTYIATISVLTRAAILGWAVDRFGEARLSRFGSMLLAIGLAAIAFLGLNDTWLESDPAELLEMVLSVARGEIGKPEIAVFLRDRCIPLN